MHNLQVENLGTEEGAKTGNKFYELIYSELELIYSELELMRLGAAACHRFPALILDLSGVRSPLVVDWHILATCKDDGGRLPAAKGYRGGMVEEW